MEQAIEVAATLDRQQRARADAQVIEAHSKAHREVLAVIAGEKADMAYLGLAPAEHSSGSKRRQGAITKAGNSAARRMLVKVA